MNSTRIKLSTYHLFLVISIVLLPYTELRLSFFGLSEVILMLAFVFEFSKKTKKIIFKDFIFTKFWILFIFVITWSLLLNLLVQTKLDTITGLGFDYASYLFVLLSCFVFEKVLVHTTINTYLMMKYIFLISSMCFAFLFLVSFYTNSIFGLELFYYQRFSPLANNPHKIAVFLIVLPFFGFKIIEVEKAMILKILVFSLIILEIIMIIKTGTSKGIIGVFLGVALYFLLKVISNKLLRKAIITVSMLVILFFIGNMWGVLVDYFDSIDYNGGRRSIYGEGLLIVSDNLLIGKGPGPHIFHDGKFMDSHQSFLTALLQGGLIAFLIFSRILLKLFFKIKNNNIFLSVYIAIYIYVLGGDVLRWNFVWVVYILIFNYRKSDELRYQLIQYPNR